MADFGASIAAAAAGAGGAATGGAAAGTAATAATAAAIPGTIVVGGQTIAVASGSAALNSAIAGAIGATGAAGVGNLLTVGNALTAASSFASLMSGIQQSRALSMQGEQAALNARLERIKGEKQSRLIRKQLEEDLASQNAIFAARGALQGEGSALAAEEASRAAATEDLQNAMFNADINVGSSLSRRDIAQANARAARQSGVTQAARTLSTRRSTSLLNGL